jgi:hypothetical protein
VRSPAKQWSDTSASKGNGQLPLSQASSQFVLFSDVPKTIDLFATVPGERLFPPSMSVEQVIVGPHLAGLR